MESSKIINHYGTTIDIACLYSIRVEPAGNKYSLVFEMNGRAGYILNPATNDWEKEIFNDKVVVEYDDHEMANLYMAEWAEIWREYAERSDGPRGS